MIDPHEAVNYIYKESKEYAKAKSERIYLEEFRKSKKALLMKAALEMGYETVSAQEREAYSHPEYIELIKGLSAAAAVEEELRWRLESARMRYEIWRTESANARLEMKVLG
jgi:hypothetical protein